MLPLTGETWVDLIVEARTTRGRPRRSRARTTGSSAPDYFRTLSMPILKGRSIEERDRTSAVTPAVISARAAQTLWPGQDAVGRQFSRGDPDQHFEVVGVVADGHPTALDAESPLMVYVPYWFNNEGKSVLVAHDGGGCERRGRRAAAGHPRGRSRDRDRGRRSAASAWSTRRSRAGGTRCGCSSRSGSWRIVIATIGVYATTAYGVSRRRREMNIRVALGARVSQVFGLVLRQSATPVAVGLAARGRGRAGARHAWWRACCSRFARATRS